MLNPPPALDLNGKPLVFDVLYITAFIYKGMLLLKDTVVRTNSG